MTAQPEISLVIPVYKARQWLPRAVDSVLAQSSPDFELILVDDGSPDDSGAICDAYAAADPRVRVIHKPNGGAASARNAGLEAARGRRLAFMDSDDQISPFLLECALQQAERFPDDFILWKYCTGESGLVKQREEMKVSVWRQEQIGNLYRNGWFGAVWAMLFDRELLQTCGVRFDESLRLGEDLVFVFQYSRALFARHPRGGFRMLEAGLYFYDNNGKQNSLSRQFAPDFCENWSRVFHETLTIAEQVFHIPAADSCAIYQNYLRTIGVGLHSVLCLENGPMDERRARARAWLAGPYADQLRRVFRQRHYFSLYYWPLRLRWLGGFARLGQMQAENESRYLTWHYRGQAIHDRIFGPVR